ncbi:MAG: hypothetical protein P4L40_06765 [Terracidiphilus sp.]|nr:hypothetical protein [Terracidiphilus sp.]
MPRDRLVIYLDENHCNNRHILAVFETASVQVERHLKHFAAGTPDEEWLPFVGTNGWALLTTDKRIRFRENEKLAVIRNRIRMFYFSKNEMSGRQMASSLEKALPAIFRLCDKQPPPFFAAITRGGEVHLREKLAVPYDVPDR